MKGLPPKRFDVLWFIDDYKRRSGESPSYDVIAGAMGTTKTTVAEHLDVLESEGYIVRQPGRARSIRVVKLPPQTVMRDPILSGSVLAGKSPMPTLNERVDLFRLLGHKLRVEVLIVRGDELNHLHIADGDLLVVNRDAEPEEGDLVAVRIGRGRHALARKGKPGEPPQYCHSLHGEIPERYAGADEVARVTGIIRRFPERISDVVRPEEGGL
ncbi:MAG TPA: S24 family peptidase [Candidatus Brocadiia bacterium]|nr:S24 family peptidase [Candidatus Brocadiia bacterium]